MLSEKKKSFNYRLFIIIILFLIVTIPFASFIPFWDGRAYYDYCLLPALSKRFNPFNFNCSVNRHPSLLYMLIVGLPQYLDKGNPFLLHSVNIILGIFAIYAFYKITNRIFPTKELRLEVYLATAIFALYPIFLANIFNLNLDYGVIVFFLLFLYLLMVNKFISTSLISLFLLFSKESGIVLYWLTIILYFTLICRRKHFSLKELAKQIAARTYLFFPGLLSGFYTLYMFFVIKSAYFIREKPSFKLIVYFLPYDLFTTQLYINLIQIFIINFNWVLTCIIGLALIFAKKNNKFNNYNKNAYKLIFWLFIIATYVLTRYKTYNNLRYFLPLYPLLIIIFLFSTISLFRSKRLRRIFLVTVFTLIFFTNFRTFDPVSKALFGVFDFGRHQLLKMTSITGECCGWGRDQLVYNLEYLNFHYLQNKIYKDIKPNQSTYILSKPLANYLLSEQLDAKNYYRSLKQKGTVIPRYVTVEDILRNKNKPKIIFFINYPNFGLDLGEVRLLLNDYSINFFKSYQEFGYELKVYQLLKNK